MMASQTFYLFLEYSLSSENLEQCVQEIESVSGVPSLMELSRNVARPALARSQKITTLFEFQKLLEKLKVPQVIEQILLMSYPFHQRIKTPEYILNYSSFFFSKHTHIQNIKCSSL